MKFDLVVTQVATGEVGSTDTPAMSVTTSKYALGLTFTEVGSSLVFDKVLADDVTPDGMPPAPFDSGSNHTTVTGSLSK